MDDPEFKKKFLVNGELKKISEITIYDVRRMRDPHKKREILNARAEWLAWERQIMGEEYERNKSYARELIRKEKNLRKELCAACGKQKIFKHDKLQEKYDYLKKML